MFGGIMISTRSALIVGFIKIAGIAVDGVYHAAFKSDDDGKSKGGNNIQ